MIDPYNDFISEGGKSWDRIKVVAEANQCVPNMLQVLDAARGAGLRIFYALHHRYRPGDYETWRYIAPIQTRAWRSKVFEDGTWGGQIRPGFEPRRDEVVAQEHWCSSGFANTDLDLQLKVHGIHRLIVIGLLAHTCLEATVRFAAELGYDVTVVKYATASYSEVEMHAALEVNIPTDSPPYGSTAADAPARPRARPYPEMRPLSLADTAVHPPDAVPPPRMVLCCWRCCGLGSADSTATSCHPHLRRVDCYQTGKSSA